MVGECQCEIFVNEKDEIEFATICKLHQGMKPIYENGKLKYVR